MVDLDNTNRDLMEGLVNLLRQEVSGWSTNSEYNVDNVWTKSPPEDVDTEFPRGAVDLVSGTDFDLSVELDVKLREVIVRVVVFGENAGEVETLIEDTESAVEDYWENYTGDWTYRNTDGFTPLNEDEGVEGKLRYNRSIDLVFECIRTTN